MIVKDFESEGLEIPFLHLPVVTRVTLKLLRDKVTYTSEEKLDAKMCEIEWSMCFLQNQWLSLVRFLALLSFPVFISYIYQKKKQASESSKY